MAIRTGDLIFTGGNDIDDRQVLRDAAAGKLARVAEGIYAKPGGPHIEEIVCGQWAPILARYVPGSILNGRSALKRSAWRERGPDMRPKFPGWIFATDPKGNARKRISLPGLEIRTVPGVGPVEGDVPFLGIYIASTARSMLENLSPSRAKQGPSRTAGREVVETELDRICDTMHEEGLRNLRAHAARIAPNLKLEQELAVLNEIIGAILGTREAKLLSTHVAAKRRADNPSDSIYLKKLANLSDEMKTFPLPSVSDPHMTIDQRSAVAFVEAYFTNYIEGTRFLVDKARRIVFDNEEADGRPKDGRDITQTFFQVSNLSKDSVMASSSVEFMDEIRQRNRILLDMRPEKSPGQFKSDANRAGNTVFVSPDLVKGTTHEAFSILQDIEHPFARALFTHAMIALIHPFTDGNGRLARIMTTKELVRNGLSRLIVPSIFRSDYIGGLRVLSSNNSSGLPFVRSMITCQNITSRVASSNLNETIVLWASTHAFLEDENHARLTMPSPDAVVEWRRGIPAPAAYWRERDLAENSGPSFGF